MKKYDAVYEWSIKQIEFLSASDEAEEYSSTLGDEDLDLFVDITEKLRMKSAVLYQAKASRQHCSAWREIRDLVDIFSKNFSTFPNAPFGKLRLFLLLCDVLAQLAPDFDTEEVDDDLLGLYSVSPTFPEAWFARENGRAFKDSVVFAKPGEISDIEVALTRESVSSKLLFHILATLPSQVNQLPEAIVFLKKDQGQRSPKDAENFIKLHFLMDGRLIHTPKTVARVPDVIDRDIVDVNIGYGQWGDLLFVLSEYNSRGESLLKFLTLYQVFEGLMFKYPIVKLERAKNGAMFSLREFKALYTSVSVNELSALENLFKSIFPLSVGATTIKSMVEMQWATLDNATGVGSIQEEVARIGVNFSGSFAGANCSANFAKMVYVIRNSVVHNKETEFHLTSESLTATLRSLIEDFLLPALEKIIFHIISARNDELWYRNQHLLLY